MELAIDWDEKYKIGNGTIDSQHEELFALYNALVSARSASDETVVSHAFEALSTYLDQHFSAEEALWRLDEELYREHRKLHFDFVKYVLQETSGGTDLDSLDKLLAFLAAWLLDHIQTVDIRHFQQLRDKGLV